MIVIGSGPLAVPAREIMTGPPERAQRTSNNPSPNRATETAPSRIHVQSPGVAGASRQSATGGGRAAAVEAAPAQAAGPVRGRMAAGA